MSLAGNGLRGRSRESAAIYAWPFNSRSSHASAESPHREPCAPVHRTSRGSRADDIAEHWIKDTLSRAVNRLEAWVSGVQGHA